MKELIINQQDNVGKVISSPESYISQTLESLKDDYPSQVEYSNLNHSLDGGFLQNTIQGFALQKPYGYAGDFMIIDKIYCEEKSNIPEYRVWDEYFHNQAAPKAVRNRKAYFKNLVADTFKNRSGKLLNVASGPARDLKEIYKENPNLQLKTTCVEMDENAIAYAKKLTHECNDDVEYIQKNVFRFKTEEKYDLIWSAGLFDYFDDKAFVLLLKRFKTWLAPGGEIVVGNFNEDHNPSRAYMEVFGEWYLNHRTENQLIELGKAAGFEANQLSVGREPEGVNLFLHVRYNI